MLRTIILVFIFICTTLSANTYNTTEQSVFGDQKLPNTLPSDFTQQEIDSILKTNNKIQ